MDNYPQVTCLPREESDRSSAEILSQILPVIFERNGFERIYSDAWWYKLKAGTAVYGIFWNPLKSNGLGDIEIKQIDLLNLFWEPGIKDIQKSKNIFHKLALWQYDGIAVFLLGFGGWRLFVAVILRHGLGGEGGNFISGPFDRAVFRKLGVDPALKPSFHIELITGVQTADLLGDLSPKNAGKIIRPVEGPGNGKHHIANFPAQRGAAVCRLPA